MEKLYYSIGEVAAALNENVSLVRFWTESFPKLLKPVCNAKGNRMYTAEDLETLRQIHFLVRGCGLTLEGAYKKLLTERGKVSRASKMMEILQELRDELTDVRKNL